MKYKPDQKQITWGITVFLAIAAGMVFYYLLFHGGTILSALQTVLRTISAVLYGVILGYILSPVLSFIENKILLPIFNRAGVDVSAAEHPKRKRWLRRCSLFLTMLFFALLIYSVFMIIIPQLIASIQSVAASMPTYIDNVNTFINTHLANVSPTASENINQLIDQGYNQIDSFVNNRLLPSMTAIVQAVTKSAWRVVRTVFNFFIGIIVSVYILNSKESFAAQGKKFLYAFLKEESANAVIAEFRYIHHTFTSFFVGKIIDSILIGLICFIGTSIIGTPFPVLVSFIVGFTNIVPIFGPYIGAAIGGFLVFIIEPWAAVYFLIFVLILQQFDGNILGPLILGSSTGLSSFWVIFSILLFGGLFGLPGWIIGVPLFAVFYSQMSRLINRKLGEKNMATQTEAYVDVAYVENGVMVSQADVSEETASRLSLSGNRPVWKKMAQAAVEAVQSLVALLEKGWKKLQKSKLFDNKKKK